MSELSTPPDMATTTRADCGLPELGVTEEPLDCGLFCCVFTVAIIALFLYVDWLLNATFSPHIVYHIIHSEIRNPQSKIPFLMGH